jgi:putative membrane protein
MRRLSHLLVLLVVLIHVGFMVLEMALWDHPLGRRIFDTTPELSAASVVLAANLGLYNGFLAAGLIWGLMSGRRQVKIFFLACIVLAGLYGGITITTTILYVQALPALAALIFVALAPTRSRRSSL